MRGYTIKTVVLVLGYRAWDWLERGSLTSILTAATDIDGDVRIVYLDNYSRDGSVQWLQEHAPEVDVLLSPTNSLYCTGVNTLVQYAARRYRPAYYLLVDADNVAEPQCYRRLVEFLDGNLQHGIAQPLVRCLADPAIIYSCGHRFTPDHWCLPNTELPVDPAVLLDLPSSSISSTAVRAGVFERCGLLNPIYEIYYESADLSARARSAGFKLACVPEAVAYNDGTEAIGIDSMHHRYYFNRNRLIYWRLHDREVFAEVAAEARRRLAELDARLAVSEYGLDATEESIRRGLTAGLTLTADEAALCRASPGLFDYDKTTAVLIQTGRPPTGDAAAHQPHHGGRVTD
ncbi:MAG: glycosyltransferase family 2 protein [Pseudonocardiaceae bacterium]